MQFFEIPENQPNAFSDFVKQSRGAASSKSAKLFHLAVYEGEEPVGAISAEIFDGMARIINILVDEKYRQRGYGKGLVNSACIFLRGERISVVTVGFVRFVDNRNPDRYDNSLYGLFDRCDFFLGTEKEVTKGGVSVSSVYGVRIIQSDM